MRETLTDREDDRGPDVRNESLPAARGPAEAWAMRLRLAAIALLVTLLLSTGGCGLYYGIIGIFKTRERVKTEGPIPPDFFIGIEVHDVADPPIDFKLSVDRSGKGTYDVTVRQPRRRHAEGELEVSEDQVVGIWNELVKRKFGELDLRFPSSGDGQDTPAGATRIRLSAGGAEMTVQTFYERNEAVEAVRAVIAGAFPKEVIEAQARRTEVGPKSFVGDTQTKLFHTPDCPALKDLPEERRRPLATWYDALDFRFQPCPECRPSPPTK